MTHLSRQTLIDWRDRPTAEARAIVVPHLAACAPCAAAYAELVRSRPVETAPVIFDAAEFVARGRAVRPAAGARRWRSRWTLIPLAAAAGIVLAVLVIRPGRPDEPPVRRGATSLTILAPIGRVDRVTEFAWDAPAGAGPFRIEILDSTGSVIHTARVAGRAFVPPPDVAARLRPGAGYQWSISRLDARGETIETSPAASFSVRR